MKDVLGFYFTELIGASGVVGSAVLSGEDFESTHLVYATASSLNIVPLALIDGSISLRLHESRQLPMVDSILFMWPYSPNCTNSLPQTDAEWTATQKVHHLKTSGPSELQTNADNRWPSLQTANSIKHGVLVLTDRQELLLFGFHRVSLQLRLMSKITWPRTALTRPVEGLESWKDSLSVDPEFRVAVVALFAHRLEFVEIHPSYPFAFLGAKPHRTPGEIEMRFHHLLTVPESLKRRGLEGQETPGSKKGRKGTEMVISSPNPSGWRFRLLLVGPSPVIDRSVSIWDVKIYSGGRQQEMDIELMDELMDIELELPDCPDTPGFIQTLDAVHFLTTSTLISVTLPNRHNQTPIITKFNLPKPIRETVSFSNSCLYIRFFCVCLSVCLNVFSFSESDLSDSRPRMVSTH